MKRIVRLTESDIERIVKRVIKEDDFDWIKQDNEDYGMLVIMDKIKNDIDSLVGKSVEFTSISGNYNFEGKISGVEYNKEDFNQSKRNELVPYEKRYKKDIVQTKGSFIVLFDNNINLKIWWYISSTGEFNNKKPIFDYKYHFCALDNGGSNSRLGVINKSASKGKNLYEIISKDYPKLMVRYLKKYGEIELMKFLKR